MDLPLFWGVIKRYKRLAIGGTVLAALLAVLTYGTPSVSGGKPTIVPRSIPTYQSQAELLISQYDGVFGRADAQTLSVGTATFLSSLSPIYAGIANGTVVQAAVRASKLPGTVIASEGVDPNTGAYTPFVNITASAPTAQGAEKLVKLGIATFQNYIAQMEANTNVPQSARVDLQVVKTGLPAVLVSGHKVTLPLLVFVAVIIALIALLFSLENRDPQTAAALGRVPAGSGPGTNGLNGGSPLPARSIFVPAGTHTRDLGQHQPRDMQSGQVGAVLLGPGAAEKPKRR